MWKFTGISVKYKTQIGTNDHKLSKILFTQTDRLIVHYQLSIVRKPPPTPPRGRARLEPVQSSKFKVAHRFAQISKIFHFAQTVKHIIPLSSHLSALSCDVAHRFPQILKISLKLESISKFKRRGIVYTPKGSSKFKVPSSKFKRRGIVYTPTLPHS